MNFAMNLTEIDCCIIECHRIPIRCHQQPYSLIYDFFRAVIAPELYGILRRHIPEKIIMYEKSGVNYLQIFYTGWMSRLDGVEHFCITDSEMDMFLHYYCNMPRNKKIDWKEHGF